MKWLPSSLFKEVDNSPLILFRIFFGALMFFEGIGAILTGWVKETFVDPSFTFNFIGFDFLQILVGPQMYVTYIVLSLLGLAIMAGWHYRLSISIFTLLWGATYLLQKSHYNNHYYLVWLIGFFLVFVPADSYRSMDAQRQPSRKSISCPYWCIFIFQLQIAIVYFYASVAKIYPDWLQAQPLGLWFSWRSYESVLWGDEFAGHLKQFFSCNGVHYFFSYAGIFFDLFVIPAFLWKKTRTLALIASLLFHLMNSMLFQIGVFPYFALSFVVFFYPRETIRRIFFPNKIPYIEATGISKPLPRWSVLILVYFLFQLLLPLRHWKIPGDVLWTEEGHRLSWRMMLRSKSGHAKVRVVNLEEGLNERIKLTDYLIRSQILDLSTKPDMMWQFAQILEKKYIKEHNITGVEVYIDSRVGVNGRSRQPFSDPTVDLTSIKWKRFGHQIWLKPRPF